MLTPREASKYPKISNLHMRLMFILRFQNMLYVFDNAPLYQYFITTYVRNFLKRDYPRK